MGRIMNNFLSLSDLIYNPGHNILTGYCVSGQVWFATIKVESDNRTAKQFYNYNLGKLDNIEKLGLLSRNEFLATAVKITESRYQSFLVLFSFAWLFYFLPNVL